MERDIYLVWCTTDGDEAHARLVGLYSDEHQARERIARARTVPGYGDYPASFRVTRTTLDHFEWGVYA